MRALFPVEKEHNLIIIFFLLTFSCILAYFNVYRAVTGIKLASSRIYKVFLLLATSLWAVFITLSYIWAISDWIFTKTSWYSQIVYFCSVVTLRVGMMSVIALLYTLFIILRFKMLHKIIDYQKWVDKGLLTLCILIFSAELLVCVPIVSCAFTPELD